MENLLRADLKRRVRKARTENFSQPKDEDQDEKEDDDDDGDKIKLGAADMPQKTLEGRPAGSRSDKCGLSRL